MRGILLMLLLSGCYAVPPPIPPTPQPSIVLVVPTQPPPSAPSAPPVPKPVTAVTQQYQRAASQETTAVTAPDATPDSVRSVHRADMDARRALRTLEAQGHHPTDAALTQARAAVKALSDVLNAPP
jgi:hypothetical protein